MEFYWLELFRNGRWVPIDFGTLDSLSDKHNEMQQDNQMRVRLAE